VCFNVSFNICLEQSSCAFIWINKRGDNLIQFNLLTCWLSEMAIMKEQKYQINKHGKGKWEF